MIPWFMVVYACAARRVSFDGHLPAIIHQLRVRRAAVHQQQNRFVRQTRNKGEEDLPPPLEECRGIRPSIRL